MEGYIKLFRKMLKWEWINDPNVLVVWIHLLLRANWEDGEWRTQVIPRGSLYTSLPMLAALSGLTIKQVRLALEKLEKGSQIVRERADKGQVITICKYDDYQASEDDEGQANGTQQGSPRVPYLRREEEKNNIERYNNAPMPALAREEPNPQPPSQDPFILSSVEKDMCRFDASLAIRIKRNKVEKILARVANEPDIQMPEEEQKKFVDWYCEPVSEGSTTVRAETLQAFTVYGTAKRWMEKRNSQAQRPSGKTEKQPLGDYYKDLINRMGNKYGFGQTDTSIPDEQ